MREIGGYLELDTYRLPMMHEKAIPLNCGRNCLAYLIRKKHIKKILLPKFLCASVADVCKREGAEIIYYSIDRNFRPLVNSTDDWVYIVNYYGQLTNDYIKSLKRLFPNIIVDNVQSYFQEPIEGIDTIYTCRKFFGVTDGAFLYTDSTEDVLVVDESFERMNYLLGRFERTASSFYNEYLLEEEKICEWDVKKMSKLTDNLLRGIDYEMVKRKRNNNFLYLHDMLKKLNKLDLSTPDGAFMYPLYIDNGAEIRKRLQAIKIFIPTLWPDVFNLCEDSELEFDLAQNILPVPVDQRYTLEDMEYMVGHIFRELNHHI